MLQRLNKLLQAGDHYQVCFSAKGEVLDSEAFKRGVFRLATRLRGRSEKSWLLYDEDPCKFIQGFLALALLKRKIVICSNTTPQWLALISNNIDAVLADTPYLGDQKPQVSLTDTIGLDSTELLNQNDWQFDGTESLVFFTSGSTGRPKAAEKQLSALLSEVAALESIFGEQLAGCSVISSVAHTHIYGFLFSLLWPLLAQRSWSNTRVEFQEQLLDFVAGKIAFVSSPAFLSRLDDQMKSRVAMVFSSGGPLSYGAAKQSAQCFGCLPVEVYGSTETGGIGYRQQSSTAEAWHRFPAVELKACEQKVELRSPYVLDDAGKPTPILLDDRIEFDDNGRFHLLGRLDRVVKIEEKRISLDEIEAHISAFDAIDRCVVLVVSGKRQVIGCAYVLSAKGKLELQHSSVQQLVQGWKKQMRNRFEAVTIPRKWRLFDAIPCNAQSKTDIIAIQCRFSSAETIKEYEGN